MRLDWIFLPRENPCAKFYIIIIIIIIIIMIIKRRNVTSWNEILSCRLNFLMIFIGINIIRFVNLTRQKSIN